MNRTSGKKRPVSLSAIMTWMVVGIVFFAIGGALFIFISVYRSSVEQNAVTASEQAVAQTTNTVGKYVQDMQDVMSLIEDCYRLPDGERQDAMNTLVKVRSDVVAILCYDEDRNIQESWTAGNAMKAHILQDLSYVERDSYQKHMLYMSKPHVESLLFNYYPWVVSVLQEMENGKGEKSRVVMDIRFSRIANYVGDVGIGQHGYCYITDLDGNIIYHPQQQLIYSGLKQENTARLADAPDGSQVEKGIIYTVKTLDNCDWRVVGVSYIDEIVNAKAGGTVRLMALLLLAVLVTALISSFVLSRMISRPIQSLVRAMGEFETKAADFSYKEVPGSLEIEALSKSFGHMVVQIQELMTKVRNEEITLRKTELKALQAQINPHFLYNTLDAIGWMCEEERNKDAVEMVNALAKLFRISISKGHELISIEKELEHARSYLMIEQFRYKNFSYQLDVEESCLPYLCNKITLQPIIENAVYHGLNRDMEDGEIRIGIHEDGEDIVFTVADNGVGMTKEQCTGILKREPGDNSGIGIKNVNDRIKIYFGESYGLTIESELDEGTCVTIRMPKIMEDTYETK